MLGYTPRGGARLLWLLSIPFISPGLTLIVLALLGLLGLAGYGAWAIVQ